MTDRNAHLGLGGNVRVGYLTAGGIAWAVVENTTCVGGHEAIADLLAGAQSSITELALGTDGDRGTSVDDRSLNNRVETVPVTSLNTSGTTITARAFVPSLLQPGVIDEVGLLVRGGGLLNHATIPPRDLTGTDTTLVVEIDITITNA